MESLFNLILLVHIGGGGISLLAAPLALIFRKGGRNHRLAGNIFFYGMSIVFVTAVYMSIAHKNLFLFLVAFFSYQMVVSGERALHYKVLRAGSRIQFIDWLILGTAAVVNSTMIVAGIYQYFTSRDPHGLAALVFGITGLGFACRDERHFRLGTSEKSAWLFRHLGGMMGGYIAAITAFLVVNFSEELPQLVVWLGPLVVGTPVISIFVSSYRSKLRRGKTLEELVTIIPRTGS